MKKMSILIASGILICHVSSFSQNLCPPYPDFIKSGTISYIRLPKSSGVLAPNFRFFYKMTISCDATPIIQGLGISDPMDPTFSLGFSWLQDSSRNITGLIDPCLILPTPPCHTTYYYHVDANIPGNQDGYIAATINCCRPYTNANLSLQFQDNNSYFEIPNGGCGLCSLCPGPVDNGIVSYIKIPPLSIKNSSLQISSNDTILSICTNRNFQYRIFATEPDGDSIAYHFSASRTFAFVNGIGFSTSEPFPAVDFKTGFTASDPAGPGVTLDPVTGMMQGTITDTGTYIVTINALEYRNGMLLDSTMQDLYVEVYDCSLLPKPTASTDSVLNNCNSFSVYFPNSSTPLYPGLNFNNTTFQWDFGDGSTSSLIYPTHTYADTGTYNARVIIFPGLYCADTAYSKVLVYPYVQSDFTYDTPCTSKPVLFTNTSTASGGLINSYYWDIQLNNKTIDSSADQDITYTFTKAPQTYAVILQVGTDKGCLAIDTQNINVWQGPYQLDSHDTILSRGATLQLEADDGNYNNGGKFLWSPVFGLNDPTIPNPVLTSTTDMTYYISMTNSHGCSLTDSIHIKYYTGPDIYLPNAFTPNGDGVNDIFRPIAVGISTFKYFRVFSRYGELLFETRQSGPGWDGNIGGRPAPMGTYVWEASGIDFNKKTINKKGTVLLIR